MYIYVMFFLNKNVSIMLSITTLAFYNYLIIYNHSSITSFLTHYGNYRTVIIFDLPTQDTISCNNNIDIIH